MNASEALELVELRGLFVDGSAQRTRRMARLSLSEAAQAGEVAISTLCRWEHLQRSPRGAGALRYARFLRELRTRTVTR